MAYVAGNIKEVEKQANGQRWYGESRHCVAAVKHFCRAPQTLHWRKGVQVKGNHSIQQGTAIATFTAPNNGYRGHAAIYMRQNNIGIQVLDQWDDSIKGKFKPRTIRFGEPRVSNNGDLFYVVQ